MALPRLAPSATSKAVIHALRGGLLATSCVFIIVAEERRRRLQTACSVVDNARRLHHVRECLAHECTPPNGRRRYSHAPLTSTTMDPDTIDTVQTALAPKRRAVFIRPPTSHLWAADRQLHLLQPLLKPHAVQRVEQRRTILSSSPAAEVEDDEDESAVQASDAIEAAQAFLRSNESTGLSAGQNYEDVIKGPSTAKFYQDAIDILVELKHHAEDAPSDRPSKPNESIRLAAAVLQKMATLGQPPRNSNSVIQRRGTKMLRLALQLKEDKAARSMIASLLSLCQRPLRVFNVIVESMEEGKSSKYMILALRLTTQQAYRRGRRVCGFVYNMLQQSRMSPSGLQGCKQLYRAMVSSGLFEWYHIGRDVQYNIRRLMVEFTDGKDIDGIVRSEMAAMKALAPDSLQVDIKIQKSLLVWESMTKQWPAAFGRIQELEDHVYSDSREFHHFVQQMIDLFVRLGPKEHLDPVVRSFVSRYGTPIKFQWVDAVIDSHASRREDHLVLSWLQFCTANGFFMNESICESFLAKCRKYWCFSAMETEALKRRLDRARQEYLKANNIKPLADCKVKGAKAPALFDKGMTTQAQKVNATRGLLPTLIARIDAGADPDAIISQALQMGLEIHDSLFNKAARALAAGGSLQAAADLCEAAARTRGQGHPLYNRYIFANLVFSYAGLERYQDLYRLLDDFQSKVQWWRGGNLVKSTLKHAMRVTAMRAADVGEGGWMETEHKAALDRLGEALDHVTRCRANNSGRKALADGMVAIVRASKGGEEDEGQAVLDEASEVAEMGEAAETGEADEAYEAEGMGEAEETGEVVVQSEAEELIVVEETGEVDEASEAGELIVVEETDEVDEATEAGETDDAESRSRPGDDDDADDGGGGGGGGGSGRKSG
ncbi:hypothetical protein XA68_10253 [Ophiocordyceps unilateralis]|uniref:Pentatricopeptide repeat protein n=1 Tax=Ophiocordyceps unilateralis TaxID=268505 RepID=A0A2A9PJ48_OPHUN|nr:hypothetical protein XA68_10253 [Ophiocordyceps unilateralis]